MVEIVNLQPNALIPDDASFVLVKGCLDDNFNIEVWTGAPSKTTIAYETDVAPLCFAIQRATEKANRRGLAIVCVQEGR